LVTARLTHAGDLPVALAVHDERPYVVDGDKKADFVGLSRGGFGNSFDVTTASERPLASDMAERFARSLSEAGYKVTVIPCDPRRAWADVLSDLAKTGAPRLVLVRMEEWKSDTYNSTALIYDMTVRVFDAQKQMIGISTVNGRDDLGGDFMNPPSHAKSAVPPAYQKKLEELLNHPAIARALQPSLPPATPAPTPAPAAPATPPPPPEAPASAPPPVS
jgi:hypothetical protein